MERILVVILLLLASCSDNINYTDDVPVIEDTCIATLSWETPTERIDGSKLMLKELQKFTIYMSDIKGLTRIIDITDVYLIQWEIRGLTEGLYWFYITVTDSGDRESSPSNKVVKECGSWKRIR